MEQDGGAMGGEAAWNDRDDQMGGSGPLILIADPYPANRENFSRHLAAIGFRTAVAESGSAALMMMRSDPPALVLIDQDMPGLSGLDVMREIRANAGGSAIPVIITTATTLPQSVIAALEAGADGHIVKPVDIGVLRAKIERQLVRAREISALRQANAALDARVTRRALEIQELRETIEALTAQNAALVSAAARLDDVTPIAAS